jgi:ubiquinone/menaquinone biosynthesis C-methylase UbiE
VLSLPFSDESFDYVVSDQVLEHIEGAPQGVMDESFRVLRRGGWVVYTTCFINPIHLEPNDFWRFTPDALALLARKFSRVVDCGGWGNPYVWVVVWLGLRFDGVPESSWHPLHNLAMRNDPE